MERFSSSGVEQTDRSQTTYHWSYDAPLGRLQFISGESSEGSIQPARESTVVVSGDLIIDERNRFALSQQTRLTQVVGTKTLSNLLETARGSCHAKA